MHIEHNNEKIEIPEETINEIFNKGRQSARKEAQQEFAKTLKETFSEVMPIKDDQKNNEIIQSLKSQIEEMRSKTTEPDDIEKIIENERAKMKQELEQTLSKEKQQLTEDRFRDEIVSHAISKGLNPKYKQVFKGIAANSIKFDYLDGDMVLKGADDKIMTDANPQTLAEQFAKDNQELFIQPKHGHGTQANKTGDERPEFRSGREAISEGLSKMLN